MIRYKLPVALAALALCVPAVAQAQPVSLQPGPAAGDLVAAAPAPYPDDTAGYGYGAGAPLGAATPASPGGSPTEMTPPVGAPVPMAPNAALPGATWMAGHYTWDTDTRNYVWITGQYVLPPHPQAQWIPGHWVQTPRSWVWVDGNWN